MKRLLFLGGLLSLVVAGAALAGAPKVTRSGDVSLITSLKMDDGMTGAPGYARALWTSAQTVRAVLLVRDSKGRLVETVVGGNPYSRTAAIAWIEPSGRMINRSFAPAGVYHMTLTVTAWDPRYPPGPFAKLTSRAETLAWSGTVPDHTKLCVPKITKTSYIGCG